MTFPDLPPGDSRPDIAEFGTALSFLTRLPGGPEGIRQPPTLAEAAWAFPLAGVVVGLLGGLALILAYLLGLPPLLAATVGVLVAVLVTGAMHEDGLADTIDGFGGGETAVDKLAVMRDGRIGAFGALAMIFSIGIRIGALAWAIPQSRIGALALLIAAEATSRAAMVRVWHDLPPARTDGLSYNAGRPAERLSALALAIAGILCALAIFFPVVTFWSAVAAFAGSLAAALVFAQICRAEIGGQTGDALGAAQQIALAAFLLLAVAFG
ncbi:MAG: adenosylcobinamide-GDP ribazoletransferase [Bauldia sp.]|nr:adenosylcobinamide-GDP ribazoletransferase [Bauldia sp.]